MKRMSLNRRSQTFLNQISCGLLLVAATIGCGPATPVAQSSSTGNASAQSEPVVNEQSPESVVAEFLDGIRRGGDAENVARLMTAKSREEYTAAGLVMQPLGAPDATFEVTRSLPYGDAGVLVNSLWTDRTAAGEAMTYQIGWALKKEPAGWRISGLILDEQPEPRVFNFESREDVAVLKQMQEVEPAEQQPVEPAVAGEQTASQGGFAIPELR